MKKISVIIFILLQLSVLAQTKVFVFKISDEIDPRTNRFSKLALNEAIRQKADLVILELNTYGGAVIDADSIRQRIIDFPIPIYAFINKNAASAGALISIACDSIYMSEGSNIGAATVVFQTGEAAPDKYQSYMRSMMRSTAEINGRDPKIAEAMVDQTLEIDSISEKGKVITFTVSEAIKNGFCEGKVQHIEEILSINNIQNYTITHFQKSTTEKIIAWFLNPAISSVLIMIIIGGIYFEVRTPGIGFPFAAAVIAALLYFVPFYLNGLAENWEILLFIIGLILIGVELFVIPGFGIAGISGITFTIAGIFLVMINNDFFDFTFVAPQKLMTSFLVIIMSMIGAFILMFFGGIGLANSKIINRLALVNTLDKKEGYTSSFLKENFKGREGIVFSTLRPSGKIQIENQILDAESRGEYIEKGEKIIVIAEDTTSLVVRKIS